MRPAEKIKAALAAADITYDEFGSIVGLTRQRLHFYFKTDVHLEDFVGGQRCMQIASKLWNLCEEGKLPINSTITGDTKIQMLKGLLKGDTVNTSPTK